MSSLTRSPVGRLRSERVFRPESVAVIGAATAEGRQIMANLMAGGFQGAVLPVDPSLKALSGVLAYPDIRSLPIAPDLALIATGPDKVEESMVALAARGANAAMVVGMAPNLREIVDYTGVRAFGPGSFGLCVPGIGLNASRAHLQPPKGRLALVSQSAALCRSLLDWAGPNGVGFSHIIGIGGNVDLGFGTALDWLSRDRETRIILLDIRRVKDRQAFLSAASAAARLRTVVAIRGGCLLSDPSGAAEQATEAALRRAGVLSVFRLEDLASAAETLTRAPAVRNESLVIVTNAIGPAYVTADTALRNGLSLVSLSAQTRELLHTNVPHAGRSLTSGAKGPPQIEGGIVYGGHDEPMRLPEMAAILGAAHEVGGILVVYAPTGQADKAAIAALAACAKTIEVPLLVAVMGETTGAEYRQDLAANGVAVFPSPEQAVRGFLHLVKNRRNRAAARELPPSTVLTVAPDRAFVRKTFARVRGEGRLELAQDEAMGVLSAYGIAVAPSRVVTNPDEAMVAAADLGFPVVVKLRRTDRPVAQLKGGLVLDLHNEEEVQLAIWSLKARQLRLGDAGPKAGFLVQRQIGRARELLIRVSDDPTFGPIISFGQGGTIAEIVRDIAVDLPPLNLPLAHGLIARTRVAATFDEFRDRPAANIEAVAEALVRVSQIIVDFPEIGELDVNPLFADESDVQVADAWIRLRGSEENGGGLAIAPYPSELVEVWEARDGEKFTIRPIRPEDAEQHAALFARLSPEDIRFRFFSAIRALSPEQTARMTQVDYGREMAFVGVRESTGEIVGVSRLVVERDGKSGEFAVIVEPDMKRKGMAGHLMRRLLDWARSRGVVEVVGQVLADNAPMIAFVKRLGFKVASLPGESDVVEARIRLEPAPAG